MYVCIKKNYIYAIKKSVISIIFLLLDEDQSAMFLITLSVERKFRLTFQVVLGYTYVIPDHYPTPEQE